MSDAKPADEKPAEEGMDGEAPAEGEDGAPVESPKVEEEVAVFKMAEDEFYPEGHVEKAYKDSALSRRTMRFYQCYGLTSFKRYNFHWLGDNCFIFTTGNTY